ncbi:MAG TPA: LacI family DNA-binding transcriptional regulator [Candidatus Polarisedimenticolia bacterium]|nr:LacI family DNA-binding transcriptional regulator [Dongiaceae bacterium]HYV89186.1 LacI family DNA-binding transcriptional regulator [Candidatus Polarisedimenticolia bacterium]
MSTLIDVARRAGVSKSTVSNVIRGASLVAEPTRRRVEQAIADMGYHPNAIARALKARASSALGIVVPDLANPFYAELAVSVERAASAIGFAVLTAHTECAPKTEEEAGRAFLERRVDGVIIAGVSLGSTLPGLLLDREVPVVLASFGEPKDKRLGVIDHDDGAAMETIVDHLYGLGHRRVAFVSQHLREYGGERRRVGFMNALAKRGLTLIDIEDGATAVVAHNDMLAIATIDRLERRGQRVPQDVSVVGYDDIPLAAHSRVRLTTVHSDAVEMGRRAVEMVVAAARDNRHVALREMQSNPLVVRSTTQRPPA